MSRSSPDRSAWAQLDKRWQQRTAPEPQVSKAQPCTGIVADGLTTGCKGQGRVGAARALRDLHAELR
ncbi:hypothetical protein NDU88_004930 [Pleurodeles waltl]|uniref:Uncharacterized protein n=1 Tax=Pleurodeles waltl TaxID=8319 RepID=A0AAV7V6K1_PLEWA|nr:hypothetical protein NDU88_004930 [Pleurodeles waltl]